MPASKRRRNMLKSYKLKAEKCDSAQAIDKLKHIADDHECCKVDLLECVKIFETLIEVNEIYRQESLQDLGRKHLDDPKGSKDWKQYAQKLEQEVHFLREIADK